MKAKIWITREGKEILVCDMGTSHLKNTMGMLERLADKRRKENFDFYMDCPEPAGEQANVDFEQQLEAIIEEDTGDYLPEIYWIMVEELDRRTE